jgi:dTDP-4-dehydrorhamnose 3,5-epimerase-like enzyme
MKTSIKDVKLIEVPKIHDVRGNLSVIENNTIPYEIKRVYYLYDVPSDAQRGGHAHIYLKQFMVALSGSFDVVLKDGENIKKITLNKPNFGLLIENGIWRELENFSSGSVCLVLASDVFVEADYIRDFDEFQLFKNGSS